MKREDNLALLETMLESFLERAVTAKEKRLGVVAGISRLDQIRLDSRRGLDITNRVGDWFADHKSWLSEETLKPGDVDRIGRILGDIRNELELESDSPPASRKIGSVIDRWSEQKSSGSARLILKKGPEKGTADETGDQTIAAFASRFSVLENLFKDYSGGKKHILSALDEALKSATMQKNKEALLLSAYIIYYLKLGGYLVDPYVKRLKQAERLQKEEAQGA